MVNLRIQGVVFDLDATLIDLGMHVDWKKAQKEIIDTYLTHGCDIEQVKKYNSKGLFNLINEINANFTSTLPVKKADEIQQKIWLILDKYEAKGVPLCNFMPGTIDTLDWLRANDIKMGVCTSNSTEISRSILKGLKMDSYFSSIVGRTFGLRMKPYPDQILACFKEMKVSPYDGVVVGDSHNDILAGNSVGALTIAIPVYFTNKEAMENAKPDAVLYKISDLPSKLLQMTPRNKPRM